VLIQFVGDPFVDAGVAVLECRLEKECSRFSEADLVAQADELEDIYSRKAWIGYLTVHFPNSCWCNFTMGADKRRQQRENLLRSFNRAAIPGRQCAYCQRLAQHIADRSAIPLLTGASTMTSGPGGEPGLPVCSACLYAIQFYPLATLKVNGRPLFWWTPQHDWMYLLTSEFAQRIAKIVEGSPEQVPTLSWPSTQLLITVEDKIRQLADHKNELPLVDLVGCHATNYGSGPDYEELRLKRGVLEFLRSAQQYSAYRAIRDRAWETIPAKAKKPDRGRRNFFFEDLGKQFRAGFERPVNMLKKYFRPQAGHEDGVFELACVFSRKVLEMTEEQVTAIKELAGQIAASKKAEDHLGRLFQARKFANYFRSLTEISDRMSRAEEGPLQTDAILRAFDLVGEDDALGRNGSLVWELLMIRLIEVLPKDRLEKLPELQLEGNEE
jgi:CRISPR-associated protein Cst1